MWIHLLNKWHIHRAGHLIRKRIRDLAGPEASEGTPCKKLKLPMFLEAIYVSVLEIGKHWNIENKLEGNPVAWRRGRLRS